MATERIIVPEIQIQIGNNGWFYSGPPGPLIGGVIVVGLLAVALLVLLVSRLSRKQNRDERG